MQTVGIDQLSFIRYREAGAVPKVSHDVIRRIQAHGFLEPVMVRPATESGMYEVLSNPEAVIAAGRLRIPDVPVVIRDDLDDRKASELVRAQQTSSSWNPVDEAEWYNDCLTEIELRGDKASRAEVARDNGVTRSHVSRSLGLLNLPVDVQSLLRAGTLTAGHGHLLAKLKDEPTAQVLAKKSVHDELSVRQLASLIKSKGQGATPKAKPPAQEKDKDILRLEEAMSEMIGCPLVIDHVTGKLTIDYLGRMDVLEGVLQRLGYTADYS